MSTTCNCETPELEKSGLVVVQPKASTSTWAINRVHSTAQFIVCVDGLYQVFHSTVDRHRCGAFTAQNLTRFSFRLLRSSYVNCSYLDRLLAYQRGFTKVSMSIDDDKAGLPGLVLQGKFPSKRANAPVLD